MQGGLRKRNLCTAVVRAGVVIGVGVVTTAAALGAPGDASATAIGVDGSSNCAGPDAWVATWRISVSPATADETWRLDAPVGEPGFRSAAEAVVVERVHAMDEPTAKLDVAITLADSETALSTSASMDRPTVCTSAPAPPAASGVVDPGDSVGDPTAASTDEPSALATTAPTATIAPATTEPDTTPTAPVPARSTANAVTPSVSTNSASRVAIGRSPSVAPAQNELPATGSTSTVLFVIAVACVAVGGLLLRLSGGPMPALAGGTSRRTERQRRATSPSPHPQIPDPAQRRHS